MENRREREKGLVFVVSVKSPPARHYQFESEMGWWGKGDISTNKSSAVVEGGLRGDYPGPSKKNVLRTPDLGGEHA